LKEIDISKGGIQKNPKRKRDDVSERSQALRPNEAKSDGADGRCMAEV